ncbi:hypothetical protein SAMN07250955_11225 [Arboricoccus pini]|uniref:Uncharacterized protein n=1 Tax=Arboricoccus pini TaxID=1963835 RepID=A0A212RQI9_9PROT|nr:hypothetical protein [Arboricoccus pini]SNB74689.1 hypothetical protein SAMN07250955_11225 [Arboricoccus pini]
MRLRALTQLARKRQLDYGRGAEIWGMVDAQATARITDVQFAGTLIGHELCVYPTNIVVELQGQQVIRVARESQPGSCWDKLIIAREQQHAAINGAAMTEAAAAIRDRLATVSQSAVDRSFAAMREELTQEISLVADQQLAATLDQGKVRHAAIEGRRPVYDVVHGCLR